MSTPPYEMVVIGASAGGFHALKSLLQRLPADFSLAIAVVQHVAPNSDGHWIKLLDDSCPIAVKEAEEKENIRPSTVYVAPANYHLLIEQDHSFSLTVEERVNYARPAIDPLFETAADAYGERLIGIVLTGANADGAEGLRAVKARGGLVIVQHPDTAEAQAMPTAAIRAAQPELLLAPSAIADVLLAFHQSQSTDRTP